MKKLLTAMMMTVLLVGCAGLHSVSPTMTQIHTSAMGDLDALSKSGRISTATEAQIKSAEDKYRAAAEATSKAWIVADKTGDKVAYATQLANTREAIAGLLDILNPFILNVRATEYQIKLMRANQL